MQKSISLTKMAYSLEEVSRLTQLEFETIESWEKELYFLNSGQTGTGNKFFRKKDVLIILRLKELFDEQGLTLAGAKRKIEQEFGIKAAAPLHPERLKKLLFRVRNQLKDIASDLEK